MGGGFAGDREMAGIGMRSDKAGERFTYKGFLVVNQDGLDDDTVRQLLDGIDYMVALFRKRGVDKALERHLKGFNLLYGKTFAGGHGQMFADWVDVSAEAIMDGGPRWVQRVFVHEFGHLVFAHLPERARVEWRSAWDEVERSDRTSAHVTAEDRRRFVNHLAANGWDVQKAGRKLSGVDRAKYLWWLHSAPSGALIESPRQVRLTARGRDLERFFRLGEYERILARDPKEAERDRWFWLVHLGVDGGQATTDWEMPPQLVEQVRGLEPPLALSDLGLPTEYAAANAGEDFAETWTEFLLREERLSDVALHRIRRTLALAGLYGKSVVRLAERVAARWLSA